NLNEPRRHLNGNLYREVHVSTPPKYGGFTGPRSIVNAPPRPPPRRSRRSCFVNHRPGWVDVSANPNDRENSPADCCIDVAPYGVPVVVLIYPRATTRNATTCTRSGGSAKSRSGNTP